MNSDFAPAPFVSLDVDAAQGAALAHALRTWEQATSLIPGGHRLVVADIDVTADGTRTSLNLTNRQAERLAYLLAADTAAVNAERSAR